MTQQLQLMLCCASDAGGAGAIITVQLCVEADDTASCVCCAPLLLSHQQLKALAEK
jgi:hypothetical protein